MISNRNKIEMLIVDVSRCNLKCSTCPNSGFSGLKNGRKGIMSVGLFRKVIDKFISEKIKVKKIWFGNWGEPLLNPDLSKMIKYAKNILHPLEIVIFTNLTHLKSPTELLKSGPTYIRISISGMTQNIYSRNHRGGNINSVLRNILALAEAKKRLNANTRIGIRYHDYVYNKKDAVLAVRFCIKNGIEFELMRPFICCVDDNINFYKEKKKFSKYFSKYIDLKKETGLMRTLNNTSECRFLKKSITIDLDGQLYRCCGVYDQKHFMGSFFDYKILEIPKIKSRICEECIRTPISWR